MKYIFFLLLLLSTGFYSSANSQGNAFFLDVEEMVYVAFTDGTSNFGTICGVEKKKDNSYHLFSTVHGTHTDGRSESVDIDFTVTKKRFSWSKYYVRNGNTSFIVEKDTRNGIRMLVGNAEDGIKFSILSKVDVDKQN